MLTKIKISKVYYTPSCSKYTIESSNGLLRRDEFNTLKELYEYYNIDSKYIIICKDEPKEYVYIGKTRKEWYIRRGNVDISEKKFSNIFNK